MGSRLTKHILLVLLFGCIFTPISSQIGAEAQGGKLTTWVAVGVDQEMNKKWMSVTDFGYGRHSDPNNYSAIKRQGLIVITEDMIYSPNKHFQFAFSLGYWRRNFYSDDSPFNSQASPRTFRNEFRPFQKIYYQHTLNAIKISHIIRTDYRFYFNQYLNDQWSTPFEFRLRYTESWKIPITGDKKNVFVVIDEVLSAIDYWSVSLQKSTGQQWSPYQITENRLSVYYRRSLLKQNIDLDIGIMHQYWREKPGTTTFNLSYNLMFDIIIKDPFTRHKNETID